MSVKPTPRWVGSRLPILILAVTAVFLLLTACAPNPSPSPAAPQVQTTTRPSATWTENTPLENPAPTVEPTSPPPTAGQTEAEAPEPAPVQGQALRIAVIGDYGQAGEPLAQVAELVKSWSPDYILTTGDNNYPEGAAETIDENIGQYFHEYIGSYQGEYGPGAETNRFFPALGNHDLNTAQGTPYFEYFDLPGNERYYAVELGPVHVFVLNSDSREPDGINRASVQAAWLQQELAASQAPWKLVVMHHSPYSSGTHGSIDYMQWPFAEWGASAVLSGHDHTYERLLVGGLPYFVNGLGGGARYQFSFPDPESAVRYRADHGAMLVEADPTQITFRFVNTSGEEIDRFNLEKSASAAPPEPEGVAASVTRLPEPAGYRWESFLSGLSNPVGLVNPQDGSSRLFVLEKAGLIRLIENGTLLTEPFMDLRDRVGARANEQGLLGLAFHPNFPETPAFYLNYTDTDGNTVIASYQAVSGPDGALRGNPGSEQRLLYVRQPYGNHNGGHLLFGPEGYLYIALGDGGSAGDPEGNAQDRATYLGKILRLDVDRGSPYAIPPGNPFLDGQDGQPEIFITGVRNPWKFSFDGATGDLYIADVGQNQWEEVSFLPAGQAAGANLGWDYREGPQAFEGSPPPNLTLIDPIAWYDHSLGCSITGGVVYRGEQLPAFQGVYLYADYCSGRIWGLLQAADGTWQNAQLFQVSGNPVEFNTGPNGELLLLDQGGTVYQLVGN